jgi:hypothetical protein
MLVVKQQRLEQRKQLFRKRLEQEHKRLFCGGKVHPTSGHRTSWPQVHIQPLELERKRRQERHMVLHKLFQHGSQ